MTRGLLLGVGAGLLVVACRPESRSPTQPPTTPAANPLAFELQHPGTHIMLLHGQTRPGVARSNAADRKSTRLNSSHSQISYAVFCLKKKKNHNHRLYSVTMPPQCRRRGGDILPRGLLI